ncbi:MAG: hypothetical protein QXS23_01040 [Desulfurococcaceae archaeon]
MNISNLLSLFKGFTKSRIYGNTSRSMGRDNHTGTMGREIAERGKYDCLAALATTSDILLAKICTDMIYRDLYK